MSRNVISLILGGGAGTRLFPLTDLRSKPAVPLAGKYRLIDIPISNCLNSGINRMFVLTQFNSASLNRHIKNSFHFDLFSKGFVDILAAEQTRGNMQWFQGTADAVRQSMSRLVNNYEFDYAMILSGDQLYQMDFRKFLGFHIKQAAQVSIATIPVHAHVATGFGIMKVDSDSTISNFIEKPSEDVLGDWQSEVDDAYKNQGRQYLASMGIYMFNRDVLRDLFEKNPDEHDFGKGIIPYAISNNYRVSSFLFDGYWTDIGTIKSFFDANMALTDPVPDFNLFDNENIVYTRARMLSPTKIFGTICEKALIAEGCIIHAERIERSVIGIRSRIGHGTVIKNAYIMGQDHYQNIDEILTQDRIPLGIGNNCYLENTITDRNAKIGNDVIIKGGDALDDEENELYCIKDGIIVIRKNVVIPHGTKIGLP